MKKSKKGVTLVELVICCAITVMLAGACTAVLISGQRVWKSGSESANAQMTADVIQTSLYGKLPSYDKATAAHKDSETEYSYTVSAATGTVIYISEDDGLVIRTNGKNMTLDDVKDMTVSLLKVGSKESARTQFNYTATLVDGREFSGGIVISNLIHKADGTNPPITVGGGLALTDLETGISLKDHAIRFYSDAPAGS